MCFVEVLTNIGFECLSVHKMKIWHGHDLGHVEVTFSLDLQPPICLRIICNSSRSVDSFVAFLKIKCKSHPKEAERFLEDFLTGLIRSLDLHDHYLKAKPENVGDPLDFGRPSPSWLMLKRFLDGLATNHVYKRVLKRHQDSLPSYINICE